jgi:GDP-mannose 6-dehydrogenase
MVPTLEEVLDHAQTIVIGNGDAMFGTILNKLQENQVIVDLVRIKDQPSDGETYDGICW